VDFYALLGYGQETTDRSSDQTLSKTSFTTSKKQMTTD